MDILKFKCPVCYSEQTEEIEGGFSINEIEEDKTCINCKKTLEVSGHFINDDDEIEVEIYYEWNDENEIWDFGISIHEGLTYFEEQDEISEVEYEELSLSEKDNYNVCDVRGEVFLKHTGACRMDPISGLMICKNCKYLETLGY